MTETRLPYSEDLPHQTHREVSGRLIEERLGNSGARRFTMPCGCRVWGYGRNAIGNTSAIASLHFCEAHAGMLNTVVEDLVNQMRGLPE